MKGFEEDPLTAAGETRAGGRSLLDVLLVAVCVVLLLAFGMLLRGDAPWTPSPDGSSPTKPSPASPTASPPASPTAPPPASSTALPSTVDPDEAPRERLMSLGFALLFVSLAVCLYTIYRLGFCCNRREYNRGRLRSGIPSVNSRLQLFSAGDLPPAYDAIMLSTQPPPYFTIVFQNEQASSAVGVGVGARPQEAG